MQRVARATLAISCALAIPPTTSRGFAAAQQQFSGATMSSPNALIKNGIICGLIGDALALSSHYEYDARKIKERGGSADFAPPGASNNGIGWGTANYHPGKKAGDLTDAGDITIMLLEFLASQRKLTQPYTFDGFAHYWKKQIDEGYGSCNFQSVGRDAKECPPGTKPGYINGGSRRTLASLESYPHAKGQMRKDIAADVNCLVAATHFLPLFLVGGSRDQLISDAVSTVYISHKNADPVAAAEFLAKTLYAIIYEQAPLVSALKSAAASSRNPRIGKWLDDAMQKVKESVDPDSPLSREEFVDDIAITSMSRLWDIGKTEPIKIGKASPTEGALPSSLYFAIKYQHDIEAALIANANCGGDSAARGIVIGMLLGSTGAVPPSRWVQSLNSLGKVSSLIGEFAPESPPVTSDKTEL